jgi:pyrroline-5-carboxylate reductase
MDKRIGFIGGGRIVRIIAAGLARDSGARDSGARKGGTLKGAAFSESSDAAAATLLGERPELRRASLSEVAAESDVIFIALPPPAIAEALGGGKLAPKAGSIVVSLSPKPSIAKLQGLIGYDRIARVIPNAPSIVGKGYNPASFSTALTDADRALVHGLLEPLGDHPEVRDEDIEAYAVLTAMGPAYFFFQVFELLRIARESGLGGEAAAKAAKSMLEGMAATALGSGLSAERVLDLIPGKPMAPNEEAIKAMYAAALPAAYAKLKA